jgi:formylglycine-generating enzyme required for sulfatase activity
MIRGVVRPSGFAGAFHAVLFVAVMSAGVLAWRAQPQPARYHEALAGTLVTFEMVRVPAGPAVLGEGERARSVQVAEFHIGRTEVTWDMYDVFALGLDRPKDTTAKADAVARPSEPYGAPDRGWGHAGYPAMSLTREAAERFCEWLAAKTGKAYRLPTEAEWARAAALAAEGLTLSESRIDQMAWHAGNAERRTHPVATKSADAIGLFDLFGNVAEWIATSDGSRIVAGGSYRNRSSDLGPASRAQQDETWNETDPQLPKSRWWLSDGPHVGFRVAVSLKSGVRHE